MKRFYHYTSIVSLRKILKSGYLKPSYFSWTDTLYGEGWYLTDLTPNNADSKLQKILWNTKLPEKTRCFIAFDIDESLLVKCRDHVYLLDIDSIPREILELNVEYFERNTFFRSQKAKKTLKYIGYNTRKNIPAGFFQDWKPILQVAGVFIGIVGVVALISSILNSE